MPGRDGSGPRGNGPFTGRGRGVCICSLDSLPPNLKKKMSKGPRDQSLGKDEEQDPE